MAKSRRRRGERDQPDHSGSARASARVHARADPARRRDDRGHRSRDRAPPRRRCRAGGARRRPRDPVARVAAPLLAAARARAAADRRAGAAGGRGRPHRAPGRRALRDPGGADRRARGLDRRRELERRGPLLRPRRRRRRGAARAAELVADGQNGAGRGGRRGGRDAGAGRGAPGLGGAERRLGGRGARGPGGEPALLVRARDRLRQDGRRARLRRRIANRRRPDPHPPAQPRRPVHRRDLRPGLQGPALAAA